MSRGPNWTQAEVKLLGNMYPTGMKAELVAAFPLRSWCAITRKAEDLGIKRDPEAANAARSDSASAAMARQKGASPGLRQHVIRGAAPERDLGIVALALQQQPALHAAWMGRAA